MLWKALVSDSTEVDYSSDRAKVCLQPGFLDRQTCYAVQHALAFDLALISYAPNVMHEDSIS